MEFSLTKLFRKNKVDLEKLRKINFGEVDAEGRVACLRDSCSRKRKPNSGYGNLYSHITTHSDWLEFYQHCCVRVKSGPIDNFVDKIHPYTEAVFGWLQFIVATNQPFSCVENADYRKFAKYDSICKHTEMKYFNLVFQNVIESLANMIPNLFGIIFDGSLNY
jgi:hypothetical protein